MPATQMARNPYALWPERWEWKNYTDAVHVVPFFQYLVNSVLLCAGCVAGTLLSCSLTAYAFARLRWRGRDVLFGACVATMLLPWHATMIPRFLLMRQLGLYDSLGALIVPCFWGNAYYIFLLRQYFRTVPEELRDAARLDGLSEWGVFWRLVVPLSKPALMVVGLLQAIAAWNDLSGPLLYLRDPRKFPLAHGLEQFVSAYSDQTHLLLAASTLFALPMMALFLVTQRYFVTGIVTTGMKQ
jgi:multiple sugar transport system permease protein